MAIIRDARIVAAYNCAEVWIREPRPGFLWQLGDAKRSPLMDGSIDPFNLRPGSVVSAVPRSPEQPAWLDIRPGHTLPKGPGRRIAILE